MNDNNELLAKLNAKYATAGFTKLANAGDWAGAANAAAGLAWGIWAECRTAAGLPADDAARNEWIAADKIRRAAKFAKR